MNDNKLTEKIENDIRRLDKTWLKAKIGNAMRIAKLSRLRQSIGLSSFTTEIPVDSNIYSTKWENHKNAKTSEPRRHAVEMHASAIMAFGLIMTLTFDLWPWTPF